MLKKEILLALFFLVLIPGSIFGQQRKLKISEQEFGKTLTVPGRNPGKDFAIVVEVADPDAKLVANFNPQPSNLRQNYNAGRWIILFSPDEEDPEGIVSLKQLYTQQTGKFYRFFLIRKSDEPVDFEKGKQDQQILYYKLIDESADFAVQGEGNLILEFRSDKGTLIPQGSIKFPGFPDIVFKAGTYVMEKPSKTKQNATVTAPGFQTAQVVVDATVVEAGKNIRQTITLQGRYGKLIIKANKAIETDRISDVQVQIDNGQSFTFNSEKQLELELNEGQHTIDVLADAKNFAAIAPITIDIQEGKTLTREVDFASFQEIEIETQPQPNASLRIISINNNPYNGEQPTRKTNSTYRLPIGRLEVEFSHPSFKRSTQFVDNSANKGSGRKKEVIQLNAEFFPWAVQTQPSGLSFKILDKNGSSKATGRTPAVKFLPAGDYELVVDDDNRWYEANVTLRGARDGDLVFKPHASFGGSIFMGSGIAFGSGGSTQGIGNIQAEALNYEFGFLNFGWGGFNVSALGVRRLALPSLVQTQTVPAYFVSVFSNPELRIGGSYLDWLEGFVFAGAGYYFSPLEYDDHNLFGRVNGTMIYYRAGVGGSLILGDLRLNLKAGFESYTVERKEYDLLIGGYTSEQTFESGLNPFVALEVDLFSMADFGGKLWRLWSKPLLDNFTY